MKKTALLPFLLLVLVCCRKPQGFDYRDVKNIKIDKLGFDKTTLSMDLVYFNPNNFGVDLKRVDCDVYLNQNYLGKYQLDTLMHINKRSEFTLPSRMSVDMRDIFKNALNVILGNEVLITTKGSTRVGKSGIFVTIPFSYEGRHKIDFFQ